jgi:hypothetical protein
VIRRPVLQRAEGEAEGGRRRRPEGGGAVGGTQNRAAIAHWLLDVAECVVGTVTAHSLI